MSIGDGDQRRVGPHDGPQTLALSSSADILIFGGSAGGGKSFSLLLEPMRHFSKPGFTAVIFRRTLTNIRKAGGLWDTSQELYPLLGGSPNISRHEWNFPSGSVLQFGHLEHEKTLADWQGSQIAFIGFDELTEFSERMFWFLMSRNRTGCGVRPYIRATCNPPEEGRPSERWVAELLDWWIGDDGFPIEERSGVLRWLVRLSEGIKFSDSRDGAIDLALKAGMPEAEARIMPKSLTFVPAKLEDNPTQSPEYRASLLAQPYADRMRLLYGNWKVRAESGQVFPRDKWKFEPVAPAGLWLCRGWDKAGTAGGKGARTAGVLIGYSIERRIWYVLHAIARRLEDVEREDLIRQIAMSDATKYGHVVHAVEQEPGSGGKHSAMVTVRALKGHDVRMFRPQGAKSTRWRGWAAQVRARNCVIINDGSWDVNDLIDELDFLSGVEETDKGKLKDQADAGSLAFNFLADSEDFDLPGELICSGDDDEHGTERELVPDDQIDELPDAIADLLRESRAYSKGIGRWDD